MLADASGSVWQRESRLKRLERVYDVGGTRVHRYLATDRNVLVLHPHAIVLEEHLNTGDDGCFILGFRGIRHCGTQANSRSDGKNERKYPLPVSCQTNLFL